jgi:hypothetical protein
MSRAKNLDFSSKNTVFAQNLDIDEINKTYPHS